MILNIINAIMDVDYQRAAETAKNGPKENAEEDTLINRNQILGASSVFFRTANF